MIEVWVELSGENPPLAAAELEHAVEALGGGPSRAPRDLPPGDGQFVQLPDADTARRLADRLAFARRCVVALAAGEERELLDRLGELVRPGESAAFRPLGAPTSSADPWVHALAERWKSGGGSVRLAEPDRRFWFAETADGRRWLAEEVAAVDRRRFHARQMPRLPFRRPVSMDPRLARAAANLARIRPGDRVVDPFVGTGALLAEAALLGARVTGADRDPEMVRGALRNFEHLGLRPERLKVADAGEAFAPEGGGRWDAILTDPPYGRSSGTDGEEAPRLLLRALTVWADRIRPGGTLALVVPTTAPRELGAGWRLETALPDRVHRSLTREFRSYRRPT